ncbi:hypothetical protein XAR_2681 [Xanthomonas citri pv. glycines str. 8ra]|nr:hypothetical protein XAR_2681 [Xanthomonas citri pv. glycines str. 8ra]
MGAIRFIAAQLGQAISSGASVMWVSGRRRCLRYLRPSLAAHAACRQCSDHHKRFRAERQRQYQPAHA